MRNKAKKIFFALLMGFSLITNAEVVGLNYESYLTSYDPAWQTVLQNLPPGPGGTSANSYAGVTVDVAFACYDFTGTPPNGLQFSSPGDLATVVNFVHSHGGKARISFGGALNSAPPCAPNYFISQTAGWPGNAAALATGVVNVVLNNNLDGVDFDLEDPAPGTPLLNQQLAADLITFLQFVRSGLPAGKTISITIPAQGFNLYWFYLATGVAALPGLVDYINFMEYDLFITPTYSFLQQIEGDLLTYTSSPSQSPPPNNAPGWGIPAHLIQIGIMPGCDDSGQVQYLSLADAESLATLALTQGFYGIMTWNLDRDSGIVQSPACNTFPSNYEYSTGIRNIIGVVTSQNPYALYPRKKRQITLNLAGSSNQ